MTKLQLLFYSLICNIVIVLVIDSISSVIGIDSSCLSLIMDLIPIILYVLSLGLCQFLIFVFWSLSPDNGPGLDRDCIGHRPAWYIFSIFVFFMLVLFVGSYFSRNGYSEQGTKFSIVG